MPFLESLYLAITLFVAASLLFISTIIFRIFSHKKIRRSTYNTLNFAALSLTILLFFQYLSNFIFPDLFIFASNMLKINFAAFLLYAFILEHPEHD